ncbi:hypothetical protein [Egicoccus sp. AB-alg2]|uniref:hypothetical protein n=1 Tax=Egicoccus sp. AB-alg2 TaxID=3242693 RepID=UPI00359E2E75
MDENQVRDDVAVGASTSLAAQQPLPFDDEADQPIPFALTARARRTVAPDTLPPLTVVDAPTVRAPATRPTDPADEDPSDTRPARARALRRAGLGAATIAKRLQVDELLVRAWIGQTLAAVAPRPPVAAAPDGEAALADDRRRRAAEEAVGRLATEPAFAAGLGLLAAVSEADAHAVTLATPRADLLVRALDWLRAHAQVDAGRVRVIVRAGSGLAADAVRHEWSRRLALEAARVTVVRWPAAPAPDAVEVLVRLHDPRTAARVGGWCDAFLAPPGDAVDAGF